LVEAPALINLRHACRIANKTIAVPAVAPMAHRYTIVGVRQSLRHHYRRGDENDERSITSPRRAFEG